MSKFKFTKLAVERAQPRILPDGSPRQAIYWDTELKTFGLLVGATSKTYIVQRNVNGKNVRVTIGRVEAFSVEAARDRARRVIGKMSGDDAINPNEEKRKARVRGITLREAWTRYQQTCKTKGLREATITGYEYTLDRYLDDWLDRPLIEISRADCRSRHQRIAKEFGRAVANNAFVVFRAIWNRTMKEHEDLPICPTINIDWVRIARRTARLPLTELHKWHAAVMASAYPIRRDALLFALFTGLRKGNVCEVRWEHVDLEAKTLHIPKPKSNRPFTIPLSDFLVALLEARKEENAKVFEKSPWVFPSISASGHLIEIKEELGEALPYMPHDLRRWFITVAESLDLSPYSIKLLVNHSTPSGDVTGGYLQVDVERLRPAMQAVTDRLKVLCTPPEKKVHVFPEGARKVS